MRHCRQRVVKMLAENRDIILQRVGQEVVIKNPGIGPVQGLCLGLGDEVIAASMDEILSEDIDVVIELIGGSSRQKHIFFRRSGTVRVWYQPTRI